MDKNVSETRDVSAWVDFLLETGCDSKLNPISVLDARPTRRCRRTASFNAGKFGAKALQITGAIFGVSALVIAIKSADLPWDYCLVAGAVLGASGFVLQQKSSEISLLTLQGLTKSDKARRAWKQLDEYCERAASGDVVMLRSTDRQPLSPELFRGNKGRALVIASYEGSEREIESTVAGGIIVERPFHCDGGGRLNCPSEQAVNSQPESEESAVLGTAAAPQVLSTSISSVSTQASVAADVPTDRVVKAGGKPKRSRKRGSWLYGIEKAHFRRWLQEYIDQKRVKGVHAAYFKTYMEAAHIHAQDGRLTSERIAELAIADCRKAKISPPSIIVAKELITNSSKDDYRDFRDFIEAKMAELKAAENEVGPGGQILLNLR